ncbi:MAG: hypothetical protein KFB94_08435 [Methylophilaceae bacterium]|nr:MAG: hypothetical protein KFB94_08435 [Methylophilaceae bacterium]
MSLSLGTDQANGSSLILFAYDRAANTSALFDLGISYKDLSLNNSSFSGDRITTQTWDLTTGDYESAWNAFSLATSPENVVWGVFALDTVGSGAGTRGIIQSFNADGGAMPPSFTTSVLIAQINTANEYIGGAEYAVDKVISTHGNSNDGASVADIDSIGTSNILNLLGQDGVNAQGGIAVASYGEDLSLYERLTAAAPLANSTFAFLPGADLLLTAEGVLSYGPINPTISISTNDDSLTVAETATITFTLSEVSTDFTVEDVVVSGGLLSNFSGSGKTYTATFTPTADSTTDGVVSVASGKFSDVTGNFNTDGSDSDNTVTMAVDTTLVDTILPTITISTDDGSLRVGETATITFTLSEASTDFTVEDVVVSGGLLSNFSGSGTTYTATFTPTADSTTDGVVSVASDKFSNAAGNFNADGSDLDNTVTMAVDTTRLMDGADANGSSLILFAYDRAANTSALFDLGISYKDLSLNNSSFSGDRITTQTWDLTTGDYESAWNAFSLATSPENVVWGVFALDTVGSGAGTRGIIQSFNADGGAMPPSFTTSVLIAQINTANEYIGGAEYAVDKVISTHGNSNDGASVADIDSIGTSNILNLLGQDGVNAQGGIAVASYGEDLSLYERLTAAAPLANSTFAFLPGADLLLTAEGVLSYGPINPTISISTNDDSLTVAETATITFTLSEVSTDFTVEDVVVSGGLLSNFSGSGKTYTATFTPTADSTTDGVVSVASGKFSDVTGNFNTDGSDSDNTVTMAVDTTLVDTILPTITISTDDGSLRVGETATITFTLSEASTDFTVEDVVVSGGLLSNFSGSGTTYTATFTPTADSTTDGVVSVASDKFSNAAGNFNADGSDLDNTVTMAVDTTRLMDGADANGSSLILFAYDRAANTSALFDLGISYKDLSLNNSSFSGDRITTQTWDLTTGDYESAWNAFSLATSPENVVWGVFALDTVGSGAGTRGIIQSFNADGGAMPPSFTTSVLIAQINTANEYIGGAEYAVDKVISTHGNSNDGASVADIDSIGTSNILNLLGQDGVNAQGGIAVASYGEDLSLYERLTAAAPLANSTFAFLPGADLLLTAEGVLSYGPINPTISISTNDDSLTVAETATITFTLSEVSTDFTVEDVVVSGGLLSNFSGSGKTYTATFTPTADSTTDGVVSVASGKFSDVTGNFNTDGSDSDNTVTMAVDTTLVDTILPTITISTDDGSLRVGETATITFTLSEASTDFTVEDVVVSGGLLSNFSGSGTTYTATFTPTADSTTDGVVSVASDKFSNAAGNFNADGSDLDNTVTMAVDTTRLMDGADANGSSLILFAYDRAANTSALFDLGISYKDLSLNNSSFSGDRITTQTWDLTTGDYESAWNAFSLATSPENVVWGVFALDTVGSGAGTRGIIQSFNADGGAMPPSFTTSVLIAQINTANEYIGGAEYAVDKVISTHGNSNDGASVADIDSIGTSNILNLLGQDGVNAQGGIAVASYGEDLSLYERLTAAAPLANSTFAFLPGADLLLTAEGVLSYGPINPTISISTNDDSLTVAETATITFTLSEVSTDFTVEDVVVSGGLLSNFSGSGKTYTATFTPTADSTTDGVVSVASGKFSDVTGNFNTDGSDSDNTVTMAVDTTLVDTILPTITISTDDGSLRVGETATITFTLSEASTDFTVEDVVVSGGLLSNFSGSGTTYTATFTPTADSTTDGVVSVASDKFSNAAGNFNADGSDLDNTVTMAVDTTRLMDGADANGSSLILFAYDRAANTSALFDLGISYKDLSLNNSSFSGDRITTQTWDLTTGDYESAWNAFSLATSPENVVWGVFALDTVGSGAGTRGIIQSFNADGGAMPPSFTTSVLIAQINTANEYIGGAEYAVDKVISTHGNSNDGASVADIDSIGTSNILNLLGQDGVNAQGGIAVASYGEDLSLYERLTAAAPLANSTFAFLPGADLLLTAEGVLSYGPINPTISISTNDDSLTVAETATITFTLSEVSTDFTVEDVVVSGGLLSNFSGSGKTYTATFTPTADSTTDGVVSVASGKFSDVTGNFNTDGSDSDNTVTMAVDTTNDVEPPLPAITAKYFVMAGSGANYIDYQLNAFPLNLQGQYTVQAGTTGVDSIRIRPGAAVDFTLSDEGSDKIYLDGNFSDYAAYLSGTTITLIRGSDATQEMVRVTRGANLLTSDVFIFADGALSSWDLFNHLKNGLDLPVLGAETSLNPLEPAADGSVLSASVKAFSLNSNGEVFVPMSHGMHLTAVGSTGIDTVYVGDGSSVDATLLGAGADKIYFRGQWSDYSKTLSGSVITFERTINNQIETVRVVGGNGALNDHLIFADGAVLSNNAKLALQSSINATIDTVTGYDASTTTPGLAPMLLESNLDDVTNLDVTSSIVLTYSEAVTAASGKYLRIINDGGDGFRGESETHTQLIEVTDESQVSIVNGTITINPRFDLDLANDYHIEIDAGAFVSVATGVASNAYDGTDTLNFSTVTPGTTSIENAAASVEMDANGDMVSSYEWLDIEGIGSPSSDNPVSLDLSTGNYALVAKDYDPAGNDEMSGYDGIKLNNLNVAAIGFGAGDLIYIDDQTNNSDALNDLGLTAMIHFGTAPTKLQFAGTDLGGFIDVTLSVSQISFDSIAAFNEEIGSTAVITG